MFTGNRISPVYDRIPDRFAKASIANLTIRPPGNGKPAIFWGRVGVGKTYAAAAIHNLLNPAGGWIAWESFVADCLTAMKSEASDAAQHDPVVWAARYKCLLTIDDLGAKMPTEKRFAENLFAEIVDARYASNRPLALTTNLSPTDIRNRYGERIFSRLFEMCEFVEMRGVNRRLA